MTDYILTGGYYPCLFEYWPLWYWALVLSSKIDASLSDSVVTAASLSTSLVCSASMSVSSVQDAELTDTSRG